MRQTSAESREIDLMMRQWKPAKQTPVTIGGGMNRTFGRAIQSCLFVLLAAATGLGSMAAAQSTATPVRTRIDLEVHSQPEASRTETVFTAHVTDTTGKALTSSETGAGTVSFEAGSVSLGAAVIDEKGDASLSVTSLPPAADGQTLTVYAVYHPAAVSETAAPTAGSNSAAAVIHSNATGVPDFTVTANPSTLTATAGQSATTAVTVTPLNGFKEQVTLSCSSLPTQVTCTFSPVISSTASGAFTSTLQVQTQTDSGAVTAPDFGVGHGPHAALAWVLPGMLALAGFASLRRRALHSSLLGLALVGLLCVGVGALSGCSTRYGYIHHPPSVATGTPVGTYALNIAASGNDGSAVTIHNIAVTLQVK